jgi:type IV pilus assembly protein PilN
MIRINLLPRDEKAKRSASPQFTFSAGELVWPVVVIGIAILVVAVSVMQQSMQISSLQKSIAQVEAQSRALAPQIERVNQLARERAELDLRLGIIAKLEKGRTQSVQVMDELARCIPDHLWLTAAQEDGSGRLNVEGVTFSNLVVSDFMSRLERSGRFGDVQLNIAESGSMDNRQVVKFRVSCAVSAEPEAN